MSTFEGKLLEDSLDFIRIDQFQPRNHNGTAFFLSHFHTDHFKGIFDDAFLRILVENENIMLYCTALTKNFILRNNRCRIPSHKIFALTMNAPYVLKHQDRQAVQITTIPAGHCPGSTMFLFEQGNIRVLYTGDFRIDPSELHKFQALHNSDGSLKKINTLYLDTTFCDPRYLSFPSRKQTQDDLTEIAQEWLQSSPEHEVAILYNSYHGLEHLLIKLATCLRTKIWVIDSQSYTNYSCIPELHSALCHCKMDSRVHLCQVKTRENCDVCLQNRINTKKIKPCAQTFNQDQLGLGRQKEGSNGLVRLAYSTHCSLEELIGIVQYLKPEFIHPCAFPTNVTAQQVLCNLQMDIRKLKKEQEEKRQENKENLQSSCSTSPPTKKFCFKSLMPEKEEETEETIVLSSGDEGEDKPLSQSSIDSPPF